MKEYIRKNREVYESISKEYLKKEKRFYPFYSKILRPFENKLWHNFKGDKKVLALGCGPGVELMILTDHRFKTTGIDISPGMVKIARRNAPLAKVFVGDFLTKNFKNKFNGIVMFSSFHLFPEQDIPQLLRKINSALLPNGYCLICLTKVDASYNGLREGYFQKVRHNPKGLKRFMRRWTENELKTLFKNLKWGRLSTFYTRSDSAWNETWMNFIIKKY